MVSSTRCAPEGLQQVCEVRLLLQCLVLVERLHREVQLRRGDHANV